MRFLFTAAIAALTVCAPAVAATYNNIQGVVLEGGVEGFYKGTIPPDHEIGDFNTDPNDPRLNIVGNTHIFGGVIHGNTSKMRYTDGWSMDFGSDTYSGVFNWSNISSKFDGRLIVGAASEVSRILAGDYKLLDGGVAPSNVRLFSLDAKGSIPLEGLTGVLSFSIDPIFGRHGSNPDEVAMWDLDLSLVPTQVPLPAGAILMLTGLLGFGLIRKRQSSSR